MENFLSNDIVRIFFVLFIITLASSVYAALALHSYIQYQKEWKKASLVKKWLFLWSDITLIFIIIATLAGWFG